MNARVGSGWWRGCVGLAVVVATFASPAGGATPPAGTRWGGPFVIGALGRGDVAADRRERRSLPQSLAAIRAYADIDVVYDPTWLTHEVESYARRMTECGDLGRAWCRREVRRVVGSTVIALGRGGRGEIVWSSSVGTAVRLGWQRIVDTPTGTMRIEDPPAELAATLLAAHPSTLAPFEFDAARERRWAEAEVDRMLYYADQLATALPDDAAGRVRIERFVSDGLARLTALRALVLDPTPVTPQPGALLPGLVEPRLPAALASQLAAVREWREAAAATVRVDPPR